MSEASRDPDTRPTVAHCREDGFTESDPRGVYIGRATVRDARVSILSVVRGWIDPHERGALGNPFSVSDHPRKGCIRAFADVLPWALALEPALEARVADLGGRALGCWCRESDENAPACHGDILVQAWKKLNGDPCDPEDHRFVICVPPEPQPRNHETVARICVRCLRTDGRHLDPDDLGPTWPNGVGTFVHPSEHGVPSGVYVE